MPVDEFGDKYELVDQEFTEYWCPAEKAWTSCPGPCPDGTSHEPEREVIRQVHRYDSMSFERWQERGRIRKRRLWGHEVR